MYKINKNIKVSDFNKETEEFLLNSGFTKDDDISKMFSDFLKEKNISLNPSYDDDLTWEFLNIQENIFIALDTYVKGITYDMDQMYQMQPNTKFIKKKVRSFFTNKESNSTPYIKDCYA